jgi:hypothetical protein
MVVRVMLLEIVECCPAPTAMGIGDGIESRSNRDFVAVLSQGRSISICTGT